MTDKKETIHLMDSRVGFWGRAACSYGMTFGMIGIGILLDSPAMQWIAAIFAFIGILSMSVNYHQRNIKTPQEAADYIAKTYGAKAP